MTCQPIELESCLNPVKMRRVCRLYNFLIGQFWILFFCGWFHNGGRFTHFCSLHRAVGPNPTSWFLTQVFIGNYAIIRVFTALDGPSNVFWFKRYGQKTKILTKIWKVWFAHIGQVLFKRNSAADWARELFKPSKYV